MNPNNPVTKAMITYYARLVKKETFRIDDVPEEYRDVVMEKVKELPDILKPEVPVTDDQETNEE